jgi:hypothetical protein
MSGRGKIFPLLQLVVDLGLGQCHSMADFLKGGRFPCETLTSFHPKTVETLDRAAQLPPKEIVTQNMLSKWMSELPVLSSPGNCLAI